MKGLLELVPAVLWEKNELDPPRVWESPLTGGIPYEKGPPEGERKATEDIPAFILELVP